MAKAWWEQGQPYGDLYEFTSLKNSCLLPPPPTHTHTHTHYTGLLCIGGFWSELVFLLVPHWREGGRRIHNTGVQAPTRFLKFCRYPLGLSIQSILVYIISGYIVYLVICMQLEETGCFFFHRRHQCLMWFGHGARKIQFPQRTYQCTHIKEVPKWTSTELLKSSIFFSCIIIQDMYNCILIAFFSSSLQ